MIVYKLSELLLEGFLDIPSMVIVIGILVLIVLSIIWKDAAAFLWSMLILPVVLYFPIYWLGMSRLFILRVIVRWVLLITLDVSFFGTLYLLIKSQFVKK